VIPVCAPVDAIARHARRQAAAVRYSGFAETSRRPEARI